MKIFAKIAALGIAATMAVAPAHAAFVFDFGNTAGQSNNGVDGPDGNSRTYSATDGGETVNVRVTGWSTDGNTVQNAFLGAYNNAGLGVTNRGETGNNGSHAIDNIGNIDFVILQFDRMMQTRQRIFQRHHPEQRARHRCDIRVRQHRARYQQRAELQRPEPGGTGIDIPRRQYFRFLRHIGFGSAQCERRRKRRQYLGGLGTDTH